MSTSLTAPQKALLLTIVNDAMDTADRTARLRKPNTKVLKNLVSKGAVRYTTTTVAEPGNPTEYLIQVQYAALSLV